VQFITCPDKVILLKPKQHVLRLSLRLTSTNIRRTRMCCKWSNHVPLCMLTLSTNTLRNWLVQSLKMSAMVHDNVLLAFVNLKGITFHSYKPNLVITTVFFTSFVAISIYQKPNCKSNIEKHLKFPKTSSIKSMGKESRMV